MARMTCFAVTLCIASAMPMMAQQAAPVVPPAQPAPTLGTADKVAISSLEKAKADLQKQYTEAMQEETAILREFEVLHPGFHVDAQTFVVSKSVTPTIAAPVAIPATKK